MDMMLKDGDDVLCDSDDDEYAGIAVRDFSLTRFVFFQMTALDESDNV